MDEAKEAKILIGSAMGTLAGCFPSTLPPKKQKAILDSALRRLQSALDALDKAQKPTAADMARTVDAQKPTSDTGAKHGS